MGGADPQGGDNLPGDPSAARKLPAAATPPRHPGSDESCSADLLKAERSNTKQLEKEIRILRQ
jgi:hypothetical protein